MSEITESIILGECTAMHIGGVNLGKGTMYWDRIIKERPILFSAPMVLAILDDRKTHTRRPVKHKHRPDIMEDDSGKPWPYFDCYVYGSPSPIKFECPFGKVGDRLWVRENLDVSSSGLYYSADSAECNHELADMFVEEKASRYYIAESRTIPSIHMPRWASRITLEITGVSVERLNDISEDDALDEGIHGTEGILSGQKRFWVPDSGMESFRTASAAFRELWESINGEGSWQQNPWVWVVEFKVIRHNDAPKPE